MVLNTTDAPTHTITRGPGDNATPWAENTHTDAKYRVLTVKDERKAQGGTDGKAGQRCERQTNKTQC
jgi:hypothetical protein